MKKLLSLTILLVLVMTFSIGAVDYPEQTVTIINPWSAGGGTDTMTRMVAPYLEKYLGTSVVVENKPGSGGQVGFTYVQNSKPDGYTIGLTNMPNFVSIALMRDVDYNWEEFRPLANIVTDPNVIAINAEDDRFNDFESFIEYAKENPGTVTLGNSGIGGDDYLASIIVEDKTGAEFQKVPFGGAEPNRTSLLGGHIAAGVFNASEVVQYVESGQLEVLAVMAEKRFEDLPEVPTANELGFNIVTGSSRGISAPPGTPDEIVETLGDAFEKALNDPELIEELENANMPRDTKITDDYKEMRDKLANDLEKLYDKYQW